MEVIEKIRWEGDKTVVVETVRRRMKRGMDEMKRFLRETSLERPEKTPDGREESLLLSRVRKQSESEDGEMRELREY